ncbi:hypothetical protein IOQ59_16865 [Pontibacterium sp. N1Y112]|uniref:Uncharacterized protein n=1 Tax=Pontibacterium sinense TaxID=2781979 RepID=A0A8J7FJC5_9GAMM|nr:hypothetical protein [Pontibacterium sinense]MBE9398933.1 hypothetical protein [Pontibacterium sinense]
MEENIKKKILAEMESIIGNSCYNGNIQNWGPGGEWYGEGREFRYPITFLDQGALKNKCRSSDPSMPIQRMRTGYYAFGANRLYIIQALEKVVERLESKYNFSPEKKPEVVFSEESTRIKSSLNNLIKCPVCRVPLKPKNLDKHFRKAHSDS